MILEEHGTPNYKRLLELLFRFECENNGAELERVVWNGLDADDGNHRRCDGERVVRAAGRMAG